MVSVDVRVGVYRSYSWSASVLALGRGVITAVLLGRWLLVAIRLRGRLVSVPGWRRLLISSVARLLGPAFQLAIRPKYTEWAVRGRTDSRTVGCRGCRTHYQNNRYPGIQTLL